MAHSDSTKPKGRTPDDPKGNRISMHIRMKPSMKRALETLSSKLGRPMIDILESGILLQGAAKPGQSALTTSGRNGNNVRLKNKKTERINRGEATNDLILSCYQCGNDEVFPNILKLYVPKGATIADATYGQGVFWKRVNCKNYTCRFSDLKKGGLPTHVRAGVDARRLPYKNNELDALVFDPPYMHTPGGTAHNGHQNFEEYYANNVVTDPVVAKQIWTETNGTPPKYHEAVLDLYFRAAREAWRVLKHEGMYIVKCQDEVCTNRNRFTHVEIMNELAKYGFSCKDILVVMRTNRPGVSRLNSPQAHARKNHSYFLIFQKPKAKKMKASLKPVVRLLKKGPKR